MITPERKVRVLEMLITEGLFGGFMITIYMPALQDLWFRQQFMADEATMSYNTAWGGTIPFPETEWERWYESWLIHHENKRFYRYLKNSGNYSGLA